MPPKPSGTQESGKSPQSVVIARQIAPTGNPGTPLRSRPRPNPHPLPPPPPPPYPQPPDRGHSRALSAMIWVLYYMCFAIICFTAFVVGGFVLASILLVLFNISFVVLGLWLVGALPWLRMLGGWVGTFLGDLVKSYKEAGGQQQQLQAEERDQRVIEEVPDIVE